MIAACNIDPVCIGVDSQIIPSTIAAHRNSLDHFVSLSRCCTREDKHQRRSKNASPAQQSHKTFPHIGLLPTFELVPMHQSRNPSDHFPLTSYKFGRSALRFSYVLALPSH